MISIIITVIAAVILYKASINVGMNISTPLKIFGGIAVFFILLFIIKEWYRLTHCPECGYKLSEIKKNPQGWLYKECHNTGCPMRAIGYQALLESR